MKKLLTIALSLIYFAVSSGIIINMHYCMGKLSGVSYHAAATSHCGKCGMDNSGCCHDDVHLIKLSNDQQAVAYFSYKLPGLQATLPVAAFAHTAIAALPDAGSILHNPPPRSSAVALSVLHCVFRI